MTLKTFRLLDIPLSILREALELQKQYPGSSLQTGDRQHTWSSPKDIWKTNIVLRDIKDAIQECASLTITELWINIVERNGAIGLHNHENGFNEVSGVLYLTTGSEIVFPDIQKVVTPRPGMLLVFPSDLNHRVELETSAEDLPRISIAFNGTTKKENNQ